MIPELHRPLAVDRIGAAGVEVVVEATAAECAALAQRIQLPSVLDLRCAFRLERDHADVLIAYGHLSARVMQTCVVSLEPLVNQIAEEVDVEFAPPRAGVRSAPHDAEDLIQEEPEPLIGNTIDLGLLATEFLILGVDPYPRKPQAALEVSAAGKPEAHPFAALAEWNKKGTVKK